MLNASSSHFDPTETWAAQDFRSAKALFVPSLKRDIVPSIGMHTTSGGKGRMAIHIRRREFIFTLGGAAAAWPLAARSQQAAVPVIGFLSSASPGGYAFFVTAFRNGLKEAGYIEGHNVAVEYRWAEGQLDRLAALAADLVSRQVAVIAADTRSTLIAKAVTTTIPIVFVSGGDPVKLGFVASFNRPGGNITGASFLTAAVAGKRLELLRDLIPTAAVIDYLVNPDYALGQPEIADAEAAARTHGLKLNVVNVVNERGEYDFDQAFATIVQHRPDALFVGGDPVLLFRRRELVPLVTRYMIPAIYNQREYVLAGGLMSYGTSIPEHARQQGIYVGRILKGEKPGDLPVTQSTRFELVINLNTAKMLGLKVPLTLQVAADEVIE
jgi:putative ABC transport system substrate-binding protein